jgi:hypothetical protein
VESEYGCYNQGPTSASLSLLHTTGAEINEYRGIVELWLTEMKVLGNKPFPVSVCPPQTPYG